MKNVVHNVNVSKNSKPKLYTLPRTNIPWCDRVWNITTGCDKVSTGCKNCYAETYAKRFWVERPFTDVRFHSERLHFSLKHPGQIIFVNSMSDLFHEAIPYEATRQVMRAIELHPLLWFVVLTKRPHRAKYFFDLATPPPNLILGVSAEDAATAEERVDLLLSIPDVKRMLSIEPYLPWKENTRKPSQAKTICMTRYLNPGLKKRSAKGILDWVVIGAESGAKRRYCSDDFIRYIVNDCLTSDVPVFVKQIHSTRSTYTITPFRVISNFNVFPKSLQVRQFPKFIQRIGGAS